MLRLEHAHGREQPARTGGQVVGLLRADTPATPHCGPDRTPDWTPRWTPGRTRRRGGVERIDRDDRPLLVGVEVFDKGPARAEADERFGPAVGSCPGVSVHSHDRVSDV